MKVKQKDQMKSEDGKEQKVFQVLLNQKSRYIDRIYNYTYAQEIDLGTMVEVPFGRGDKIYEGIVVGKQEWIHSVQPLKEILRVSEESFALNPKKLQLAQWIREQYLCSHIDAISLFYPQSIRGAVEKYRYEITVLNREALRQALHRLPSNASQKKRLYEWLLNNEICYEDDLRKLLGVAAARHLKALWEEELLTREAKRFYRDVLPKVGQDVSAVRLNEAQQRALEEILAERAHSNRPVLLHGITGSGKTEIYIRLMEKVRSEGKGVIVLVPEISLTSQTVARFSAVAEGELAILHSHLSKSEKADEWSRIQQMEAPVVIGARSAIFAPMDRLGLIIMDECHDEAYKSEQSPKYDAVELAEEMSRVLGCGLLMGSATPTIVQYHRGKSGRYKLVQLLERANARPLPSVEIVSMIDDAKDGNLSFLSGKLRRYMQQELGLGNQVVLYLNRRGYAGFVVCRSCGHIPRCEHCDISLTYHKERNVLRCHYCNYQIPFDRKCPACQEGRLEDRGMGTERIAQEAENFFPTAKIFRMDRDTIRKKNDYDRIFQSFRDSEGGVLVGTQMIGKGHDFPKVNLVGIINADQGMYFPDYRSNERTFSSIEQVGGRAGRGSRSGRVVIQTFSPHHLMLNHLIRHDYESFYEEEIRLRQAYVYPPYGNLLRVLVVGRDETKTGTSAMKIKDAFCFYAAKKGLPIEELYGPYPCMISKMEGRYRWQILMKDVYIPMELIKKILHFILTEKRSIVLEKEVYATVDINPSNMV